MAHGDVRELSDEVNALSRSVIGCAIEVHKNLGPGLLERIYQVALLHELREREILVESEKEIVGKYKGIELRGQRVDLLVESQIVVELKSVERVLDVHAAQLVSYLRLGGYQMGLLINFNTPRLIDGVQRRVLSSASCDNDSLRPLRPISASSALKGSHAACE